MTSEFKLPDNFTVTAHTGCMNTEANTTESIVAGFSSGADIIEIDIRFLTDGTPVLTHNILSAEKQNSAVRLCEAFDVIKNYPDKKVNLDIKETSNMPEIQRLAKEKSIIDQLFFTGVNAGFVEAVKKGCPEISYYINMKVPNVFKHSVWYIRHTIKKVKKYGAIGLNTNKVMCSPMLVREFHNAGLLVSVWTITDIDGAKKYLSMSPDNITCKNPDEVIPLVKQ